MALADFLGPFLPVPGAADSVTPAPPAPGKTPRCLAVVMPRPKPTEWCWAATTSAVCTYFAGRGSGAPASPCEIATVWLQTACCPEPTDPNDSRNVPFGLEGPLGAPPGHLAEPPSAALEFDQVMAQIDLGRPVCCHIAWHATSPDQGHYNMIVGYDPATQDVDVRDCLYSDSSLPFDAFRNAYQGSGSWDTSYLTK